MTEARVEGEDGRRGAKALLVTLVVLAAAGAWALLGGRDGAPEPGAAAGAGPPTTSAQVAREPQEPTGRVVEGQEAPPLQLSALAGGHAPSLADLRGRVVVLNAWASWCAPCIEEMPSLERMHRELSDEGVTVLAVAVDDPAEPARALAKRLGLTMPQALDQGGRQMAKWGTVKYPETWVIGPDGVVASRVVGARDWAHPDTLAELRGMAGR